MTRLIGALAVTSVVVGAAVACGPEPTKAVYTEQRKVPFFRVLAYERLETRQAFVEVMLFEDEAGNCYITSGTDGGIQVAPPSACGKARKPDVETKGEQ